MASRRNPPIPPRVFAPEVSHPMMDDFTLRALRHQAKQAPGTPVVTQIPLRQHPIWSGNNELGFQLSYSDVNIGLLPKGAGLDRQMVLKLGEWGAPEVWSVMLGMEFDETLDSGGSGFSVTCQALIGCGGITQEVILDWKKGTSFSATMNALTLNASFSATNTIPPELRIRATVAKGKLSSIPPTRSIDVGLIGATTLSPLFPIPFFAQRFYLMGQEFVGNNIYNAGNTINLYGTTNAGSKIAEIPANLILNFSNGVPLPARAKYIAYDNQAIAGTVQPTFVFDLGL